MNSDIKRPRKINPCLTRKVIELQAQGYDFDYDVISCGQLVCVQSNQVIPVELVDIRIVEHGYDQLSRCFKFVHAIETVNGEKGVMVTNAMITRRTIPRFRLTELQDFVKTIFREKAAV